MQTYTQTALCPLQMQVGQAEVPASEVLLVTFRVLCTSQVEPYTPLWPLRRPARGQLACKMTNSVPLCIITLQITNT